MANLRTGGPDRVIKIGRWRGINEAEEGEASLASGEAAVMENFRVTAGGALQKRGGYEIAAGLMEAYTMQEGEAEVLFSEDGVSALSLSLRPEASLDSGGRVITGGEPVTVALQNAAAHRDFYLDRGGRVYKFLGVREISI